ncbi:hypothetical protein MBORA_16000 [Methanobrevibacter oralis]|uniref:TFIIB-type domain-containing protein n=1 Tax=Methanobrevibacter oralis TaxID=66851 RepID=A0A162FDC4_METOA|nr:hypothetical protein [Methanobrevibacter oralis]KZX11355.1 hypothetical protein MBORA_16000 [Methanobrevibacter oralis]
MCDEKISDDTKLKHESPINYYLKHFHDQEIMAELRWCDPYLYLQICRIHFIQQLKDKTISYKCPECETKTIIENDWGEEYCSKCGLVVRTSFDYVGGLKINLPYGKKI